MAFVEYFFAGEDVTTQMPHVDRAFAQFHDAVALFESFAHLDVAV